MTPKALGFGWAHLRTEADAVEAVRRAIELGVDYMDTSAGYGDSERLLGLALADGWRERVYLQTKTGTHRDRRGDYSGEGTRWSVENSLRRLRTDYLDAVLIHDPADIEPALAPGGALDELWRMKEEGIVGHVGLGCRQQHFHRRAIETGRLEIVLTFLDYNLMNQSAAATTLPLARERGVGVILASALGLGRLTGVEPDRGAEPLAHRMWQWCRERGVNIRHLSMQFCLAADIEGIVLAGPKDRKEVDDAIEAATVEVPPGVWAAFKAEFGVGL